MHIPTSASDGIYTWLWLKTINPKWSIPYENLDPCHSFAPKSPYL